MIKFGDRDQSGGNKFWIRSTTGLVVKIAGGILHKMNDAKVIQPVTLTLTASSDNYVFVDWVGEDVEANVTGFPAKSLPLYVVTTNGTDVTKVKDMRSSARVAAHTEFKTRNAYLLNTVFNANQDWIDLDLSGPAPKGATGVLLGINVMDSGTPGSTVYFRIRKPGETDLTRAITVYPQASGIYVYGFASMGMDGQKIQYKASISGAMTVKLALMGWIYGS